MAAMRIPSISTEEGNMIHYQIHNKVFATLEEAMGYERLYRKATGVFLVIESTKRKVTHTFTRETEGG